MVMFFGRIEEMFLMSTLSEGANVLRDSVISSYMANYLGLINNDVVILQAKGCGPSYWSAGTDNLSRITVHSYNARISRKTNVAYASQAAQAETVRATTATAKSPAVCGPQTANEKAAMGTAMTSPPMTSPPTKSSSKSADAGNLERLLEAQQEIIKELTLKAQEARIGELEMAISNSNSGRSVADKYQCDSSSYKIQRYHR